MFHDRNIPAKKVTSATTDGDDGPLYAPSKRVFPQSVKGTYRRIKWIVLAVTLGIYYLLPFVRWDRGPNAPDQAVLIDFPSRRFYFFFIEIWPQEIYYLTGLLVLAAMALFFMNAVAGRVWCGYLCPQTVWTDLFYAVERFFEGDRRERMRNQGKWTLEIVANKAGKHTVWLLIAWWTGGAWVLYFADAPTLVKELATFKAPGGCLDLDRHSHLHHLFARRLHARAGLHLHVPVAAHPGRADRRACPERHLPLRPRRAARFAEAERAVAASRDSPPAIASTAASALPCARPAWISAKACRSTASSAAFASMPATRSWRRSTARRA